MNHSNALFFTTNRVFPSNQLIPLFSLTGMLIAPLVERSID